MLVRFLFSEALWHSQFAILQYIPSRYNPVVSDLGRHAVKHVELCRAFFTTFARVTPSNLSQPCSLLGPEKWKNVLLVGEVHERTRERKTRRNRLPSRDESSMMSKIHPRMTEHMDGSKNQFSKIFKNGCRYEEGYHSRATTNWRSPENPATARGTKKIRSGIGRSPDQSILTKERHKTTHEPHTFHFVTKLWQQPSLDVTRHIHQTHSTSSRNRTQHIHLLTYIHNVKAMHHVPSGGPSTRASQQA